MSGPEAWVLFFSANAVLSGQRDPPGARQIPTNPNLAADPTPAKCLVHRSAPGEAGEGHAYTRQGRLAARAPGQAIGQRHLFPGRLPTPLACCQAGETINIPRSANSAPTITPNNSNEGHPKQRDVCPRQRTNRKRRQSGSEAGPPAANPSQDVKEEIIFL